MEHYGRWIGGNFVFVSAEKADRALSSNVALPGDIIVTQRGTLGQVSIIPGSPDTDRYIVSQSQMAISVDARQADPLFVYYYLRSPAFNVYLANATIQTGVPHINLGILRNAPVDWPGRTVQKQIAETLGALDDKIELNRRMNETLEGMAQAIFRDWLTSTKAGQNGTKVSQLEKMGVLLVNDGYRAKNQELGEPGLPFIRAAELKNGFDTQKAERLNSRYLHMVGNKVAKIGDVAFTSKGTIGRFGRVGEYTEAFVYSPQVCFWRSLDEKRLRPEILYLWMTGIELRNQIDAVAGQTDMAPYVSLRDQRSMLMPEFGDEQHRVADMVQPLLSKIDVNLHQTSTLTKVRDLLLPKLISGEVRLREAEEALEAAQ